MLQGKPGAAIPTLQERKMTASRWHFPGLTPGLSDLKASVACSIHEGTIREHCEPCARGNAGATDFETDVCCCLSRQVAFPFFCVSRRFSPARIWASSQPLLLPLLVHSPAHLQDRRESLAFQCAPFPFTLVWVSISTCSKPATGHPSPPPLPAICPLTASLLAGTAL